MEEVAYIQIPEEKYSVFKPDGTHLADVNYWEFNEIRIQCKQLKLEGYTLLLPNCKIWIDSSGKLWNLNDDGTRSSSRKQAIFLDRPVIQMSKLI